MKTKLLELLCSVVLAIVLPAVLAAGGTKMPPVTQQEQTDGTLESVLTIPVLLPDHTVEQMELNTYLYRVLLAEMPAEFEVEALKAQAVVARSYTLRRYQNFTKHAYAAVCTDSACCQAYCHEDDYLAKGENPNLMDKVYRAVCETDCLVLTYQNKIIDATYFACSGGRTEDALAVWGEEVPYLQSVESPGEEKAAHYTDTMILDAESVRSKLGISVSGAPTRWISNVTYTAGGGVDTITICGVEWKGTEVRRKLNLPSTAFVMTAMNDRVVITTKGHGHRVGMSQYGAEAMAVAGKDFREILLHYYSGVVLEPWTADF